MVQDIASNWVTLSQNSKFHAIFATSSIPEAIKYYRLMKQHCPELKITALFDPNIAQASDSSDASNSSEAGEGGDSGEASDNNAAFKTDGLVEIIGDYNQHFGQRFDLGSHAGFKKDIACRLAHKEPYLRVHAEPGAQLDVLIVVNQMLTGFDSKWINTLYLDKVLAYESIIQAFSRTNRLFGPDKPFGTVRYYRKPHTMARNVAAAVKLYSGDKATGLFMDRLPENLARMNASFVEISAIFSAAGVVDFASLPSELAACAAFAKQFNHLSAILEAAKIQGFVWEQSAHAFEGEPNTQSTLTITHHQYLTLLQRYKELAAGSGGMGGERIAFDIDTHITEIDTGKIDADYMNSRFKKFLKELKNGSAQAREATLADLHRSFTSLSQVDQKTAEIFLNDIQRGDVQIDSDRSFRDYLTDYQMQAQNSRVATLVQVFGLSEPKLRAMMNANITEANLNDYGRVDDLKQSVNKPLASVYFERVTGQVLPAFKVNVKVAALLKKFVLTGAFELDAAESE